MLAYRLQLPTSVLEKASTSPVIASSNQAICTLLDHLDVVSTGQKGYAKKALLKFLNDQVLVPRQKS